MVNQKAKLFEGSTNFTVYRGDGTEIAAVRQVGQSAVGKLLKATSRFDMLMSATFEIVDRSGAVQLVIEKPRTFLKGRVSVHRPDGGEIGQIVTKLRLGKARFLLNVGDSQIGEIDAQNFRGWDFAITDANGGKVGRISKTWAGFGKEMFTNADNYVVEIDRAVADPLRSLMVASALTIDALMKQAK